MPYLNVSWLPGSEVVVAQRIQVLKLLLLHNVYRCCNKLRRARSSSSAAHDLLHPRTLTASVPVPAQHYGPACGEWDRGCRAGKCSRLCVIYQQYASWGLQASNIRKRPRLRAHIHTDGHLAGVCNLVDGVRVEK